MDWLISLGMMCSRFILVTCIITPFLLKAKTPLYEYTTFVYAFLLQWTVVLLPAVGGCEQCCHGHGCTNLSLTLDFQFFWVDTQSRIAGFYGKYVSFFEDVPYCFS